MVKIIAILKNDLQARAGQLLMQLDDGQIVAADMPGIQAVAKATKAAEPTKAAEAVPAPRHDEKGIKARKLILRGLKLMEVVRRTGLARSTVQRHYRELIAEGHIKGPHHWFKSVEELEKARQRGAAIGGKNKKNGVAHA